MVGGGSMELRASPQDNFGAYHDTSIAKVAETPLEGARSAPETFGPFTTNNKPRRTNSKGYSVRFEEKQPQLHDPIERAIDSIILFIDEVRETSNTVRNGNNGCMNSALDVCVSECRNPCADPCTESFENMNMQPPVDLMLNVPQPVGPVEEEKREEPEIVRVQSPVVQEEPEKILVHEAVVKVTFVEDTDEIAPNSLKDLGVEKAKEPAQAVKTASAMPTYTPVDTISDKVRTLIPEDTLKLMLDSTQLMSDSFVLETGEVRQDAEELTVKNGVDPDPIIEIIDRLIMFFDDIHDVLMKTNMDLIVAKTTQDLQDLKKERMEESKDEAPQEEIKKETKMVKETKLEETVLDLDNDKSENTSMSEDTMKTENKERVPFSIQMAESESMQMAEAEYAAAVESAAALLSEAAIQDVENEVSREELHQQALERIMSERPEIEEGFTEYKTEEMILEELMRGADQAIMDAHSTSRSFDDHDQQRDNGLAEELVVLGHSATLTPIPEADEASAGTPASDMIDQGVMSGTIPEVPLLPDVLTQPEQPKSEEHMMEKEETPIVTAPAQVAVAPAPVAVAKPEVASTPAEVAVAPAEVASAQVGAGPSEVVVDQTTDVAASAPEAPQKVQVQESEEEVDPIVYIIDNLFLFCDDLQENKPCEGCVGASVPSDLVDPNDDIVEPIDQEEKTEQDEDATASLEPRLNSFDDPVDSRGQMMLEEALRLVQEASVKSDVGHEELREALSSDTDRFIAKNASDIIDKLAVTFDDTNDVTKEGEEGEKKIICPHGIGLADTEKNRAVAKLLEAAFEENDKLRSAWNMVVEHPGMKGKERDPSMTTPQMSLDTDTEKQQETKVEFEIPELMKQSEDPYIAWGGDDSELMASINADRKLSEMEHENIFRDVSKGLQESSGGIITRADNQDVFSIYKAPAFTEGNSGSAELPEDRLENPAQAALKVLCAESISCGESESSNDVKGAASGSSDAAKAKELGKKFTGWSLSKKREEVLRSRLGEP